MNRKRDDGRITKGRRSASESERVFITEDRKFQQRRFWSQSGAHNKTSEEFRDQLDDEAHICARQKNKKVERHFDWNY